MRGRQVFLETLLAHGVDRIFGNPGTTESPLLDSLLDYPQLQYIVHLHEGVAVGAANFYGQAIGYTIDNQGGTNFYWDMAANSSIVTGSGSYYEISLRELSY